MEWLGFWIFCACVAIAFGIANNGLPSAQEIREGARKEVAVELAKRGADPRLVECILRPPMWGACPQ